MPSYVEVNRVRCGTEANARMWMNLDCCGMFMVVVTYIGIGYAFVVVPVSPPNALTTSETLGIKRFKNHQKKQVK